MAIDYTKSSSGEEPTSTSSARSGSGVSLSKVTLTKSSPTVSLAKSSLGGILRVNLNWSARPAGASSGGGFLKKLRGSPAIDLDLACLYELDEGKGVVQALGGSFGVELTDSTKPVIKLDGDDRSGSNTGGENLLIDLGQLAHIKRILVFTFIYEGVANWAAADAVVTLHQPDGPQIEVRLDEHDPSSRFCAIALLENVGGSLSVRREVRYIQGSQRAMDEAYGWGLAWAPGRK